MKRKTYVAPTSALSSTLSSLRHRFIEHADGSTLCSILRQAVLLRLGVWLAMALVSQLFTHNAEGVVTYPFRNSNLDSCFAYAGSWCDCGSSCSWADVDVVSPTCAIAQQRLHKNAIQQVYTILLTPLTRWDAAHFLRLALHPQLRVPHPGGENEDSEKAHAFLPLYPRAIQCVAQLLLALLPAPLLPATCEETLVLAAYGVTTVSFVASVVTFFLLTCELLGERIARRSTILFVINPAGVFFQAYSEALFAFLMFTGGYFAALSRYTPFNWKGLLAAACWWLSTWTRTNGALYYGFLMLWGVALALHRRNAMLFLLTACLGLLLYQSSLRLHNQHGYNHHCSGPEQPAWCSSGPSFDLYTHVQGQHWNVGLFRYYQWKQLPNFILAAPVLAVAISGVVSWIAASWKRSQSNHAVWWALEALRDSVAAMPPKAQSSHSVVDTCYGPHLLPHYAVLAAAALLGLLVAHVQISTRLICSSCPALYWHMTAVVSNPSSSRWGGLLVVWCLLYIVLGIVLHSTWLPWT